MKSINTTKNEKSLNMDGYKLDLENKAFELAQYHNWMGLSKNGISLQDYIKTKKASIQSAYTEINNYYYMTEDVIPAAEWYLDNYYLINDLLKETEKDLSRPCEAKLNYFKEGDHSGYPRIYVLITEYIKYAHDELDFDALRLFVSRYQKEAPLSSAEIWAIPIILRIILLERLHSQVEKIISTQRERESAENWLKSILNSDLEEKQRIRQNPRQEYSPVFIERVARRLKDYGPDAKVLLNWLDNIAANSNKTVEDIMAAEQYSQTSSGVGMGNIIAAIKLVNSENWSAFFEDVSLVQEILRNDPAGVFNQMDFGSRDKYRHEIENLAHQYKVSEISVARLIREYARDAAELPQKHVGYYLLGAGRIEIEKELAISFGRVKRKLHSINCFFRQKPGSGYFSAIIAITLLIIGIFFWKITGTEHLNAGLPLVLLFFSVLVLGNGIAVYTINRVACKLLPPAFLPKIDFEQGLDEENKTIVVIPAIFKQAAKVKELFAHLEQHYLNNRSSNLFFAILGDFADCRQEEAEYDQEIIYTAQKEILKLNKKYDTDCFYYFHRKRTWNEKEKKWMGWERKRGKLIQFNNLLINNDQNSDYNIRIGAISKLHNIRYVVTADADTVLPSQAVIKLVGIMAHPLHSAKLNAEGKLINTGYGIIQPRIGILASSASATGFSRLFTGNAGIDPYTCAISDIYQDLFGEGIFTGKGIYDLQSFNQVTGNRFPENRILSHDLIEGLFARTALATDIEFFDAYPGKYLAYTSRLHRWIRGDWQIARYIFHSELPVVSRWKILDNLRRSLEEPFQLTLIILGFAVFENVLPYIMGLVLFSMGLPFIINLSERIITRSLTYRIFNREIKIEFIRILFALAVLPYQALIQLDAVFRSLVRQITGRYLLEWETAADSERRVGTNALTYYRKMLPGLMVSLVMAVLFPSLSTSAAILLGCLMFGWLGSPWAAYRLSLSSEKEQKFNQEEIQELRFFAREIWGFFDRFINEADHYLPPDNVQLEPNKGIAHRTSPTNIGLAFLANLSAYDFGYIPAGLMIERTEKMLQTIGKLGKWNGHLYNWYDTETLKPLHPIYVSTVDSGNLAGYYLALKNGLGELIDQKVIDRRIIQGFKDTCQVLNAFDEKKKNTETIIQFLEELKQFEVEIDLQKLYGFLKKWRREIKKPDGSGEEFWRYSLWKMIEDTQAEMDRFFPWLSLERKSWPERSDPEFRDCTYRELTVVYRRLLEEDLSAEFKQKAAEGLSNIIDLFNRSGRIQKELYQQAMSMDFKPLFDQQKKLFAIGYNVTEQRLDKSYYDLMASEARQTSLLAIAKGDVPQSHWFKLSRPLTKIKGQRCLVSWSGTMFEFLMPLVLIKNFKNTLLDETYQAVVKIQKSYGDSCQIPWGISESGFFLFDVQNNYQYKAFGVPGLGLKRGLTRDMVISPYSTFMALMVDGKTALANLRKMRGYGFNGQFGLYEAIDFTPDRVQYKRQYSIVKSYMAHHQGMSLASLTNAVFDQSMQERFHREPQIKAVELILQEQVPLKEYTFNPIIEETREKKLSSKAKKLGEKPVTYSNPNTVLPRTHFLSNGEYSVMLTLSGSGYSKYNKKYLTRWREDQTMDEYGSYIYVHNLNSGSVWSAFSKPLNHQVEEYKVTCFPNLIRYSRKDGNVITQTEIFVSPEDPVEIRKVSLTNESKYDRDIELTSFAEIVLDELPADQAHPAFNKLFIQTGFDQGTLYASKRSRHHCNRSDFFLMHTVFVEGEQIGDLEFETDRVKFIGRGRDYANPRALETNQPLSNSAGSVLDPIMSMRVRVRVHPGKTKEVFFLTGVSEDKQSIKTLSEKYRNSNMLKKARELSWSHNLMELTSLDLSFEEANLLMSLASHVVFLSNQQRSGFVKNNSKGQSSLWAYGISGDLPVIILRLQELDQLNILEQMLKIHEYWKIKGLFIDLVVMNEDKTGYYQTVQERINEKIGISHARRLMNKPGGVFLLKRDQLPPDIQYLLFSTARLVFSGENGSLRNQILKQVKLGERTIGLNQNALSAEQSKAEIEKIEHSRQNHKIGLLYYNGFGGFTCEGKEYVIEIGPEKATPMPWVNVIANPVFGSVVSEAGSSWTWSQNSREYKLSPWFNDPLLDKTGEAVYIKEIESGQYWSPLPKPAMGNGSYLVRHGQGYSVFSHERSGIVQETIMYVPMDKSCKVVELKLNNTTKTTKTLAVYYYMEWVLGVNRNQNAQFILSEEENGTIFARNTYQEEFTGRTAYLTVLGGDNFAYTCSREEFIGNNRSLERPAGLGKRKLEALQGIDPCGVLQTEVKIGPGSESKLFFVIGDEKDAAAARAAVQTLSPESVEDDLNKVKTYWDTLLSTIQIETPDQSFNFLFNRWLLYQTLVCRIWARSAYYQAGGAFGFRDQLQDVMALTAIEPQITRQQILLNSSRQFEEGDVQHWWHQENGKGIRTKFSDDLLWLPYVTLDYIEHTTDYSILDEQAGYLADQTLAADEDERYSVPAKSGLTGTIYEHCLKAIDYSLKFGEHGLPLIGTGDWNDGFSAVGREGKGESVWLGWFLLSVLQKMIPITQRMHDSENTQRYQKVMEELKDHIEKHGWDGAWYRRAFFDNADPLGSITCMECQIDAIAQSWAVISGFARESRAKDAMLALENYLWDKNEGILKLLTPPFDQSGVYPGYIQGYVPGVRENGGQYTHAAIWAVWAYTKLHDGEKAVELFNMLNPINHARTDKEAVRYKVEPYVMAADVYSYPPNNGRGGWSWYTGAAGWMYQVALEGILGLSIEGDKISVKPCIPGSWPGFKIKYKYRSTQYHIEVINASKAEEKILLDGQAVLEPQITLADDGKEHEIVIII